MQVYIILNIARQQDGEYVFVNVEKVFKSKEKAESYLLNKKNRQTIILQNIQCLSEYGITEATIED